MEVLSNITMEVKQETKEERVRRLRLEANKRYYQKYREQVIEKVKKNYARRLEENEAETRERTSALYRKRYAENEKYKEYKAMYYEKMKDEYNQNKDFYMFLKEHSSIKDTIE